MLESSVVTDSVGTVSLPIWLNTDIQVVWLSQEGKITTSVWHVGEGDCNNHWHLSASDLLNEAKLEEEAKLKKEAEESG